MPVDSTSRRSGSACRCQALCTVPYQNDWLSHPSFLPFLYTTPALDNRKEPNGPRTDLRMDNDQRRNHVRAHNDSQRLQTRPADEVMMSQLL
jgi:hypothetical protein